VALYVFGIMRAGDADRAVSASQTHGRPPLEAVEHGGVSGLVSPTGEGELRLRRDTILAHSDVLQASFEHGPVLPFRFGTVVADAETVVQDLLAPSAQRALARLNALEGKVEMQVKATYAEEPLLRSILGQDRALARHVQRTQALPAAATHFDRIRIGEAIAAAIQARQAADQEALLRALSPRAVAHAVSQPHHERAVLNAGFLVDRVELAQFDQVVESLSRERADEIEFTLIGPLPAYSFADRDWALAGATAGGATWG
jgi:hypothetical protein